MVKWYLLKAVFTLPCLTHNVMAFDVETAFSDLGVNAIIGTEMLDLLGLSSVDLQIPQRFSRLQSIISYFKDLPEDTRRFLITKATRGKMVNRLDHVFEYMNLLKNKAARQQELEENTSQLQKFKAIGDFENVSIAQVKETQIKESLGRVDEEIYLYEK